MNLIFVSIGFTWFFLPLYQTPPQHQPSIKPSTKMQRHLKMSRMKSSFKSSQQALREQRRKGLLKKKSEEAISKVQGKKDRLERDLRKVVFPFAPTSKPVSTLATYRPRQRSKAKPPKLPTLTGGLFWVQTFGVLLALGVVVIFIYLVLRWIAKQLGIVTKANQGRLVVKDRLLIEPKRSLWIIAVDGEELLLATHEQGISLLKALPAEEDEEEERRHVAFSEKLNEKEVLAATSKETSQEKGLIKDPIPTQFEVVSDGRENRSKTSKEG